MTHVRVADAARAGLLSVPSDVVRARLWIAAAFALTVSGAAVVMLVSDGLSAAALTLAAAAAAAVGLLRPAVLGPLVALLLPAGYGFPILGTRASVLEAVMIGAGAGYLARLLARLDEPRFGVAHGAFACLVVGASVSMLGPAGPAEQLRPLLWLGSLALLFHAVTSHVGRRTVRRMLVGALAVVTMVEASLALYDYAATSSERFTRLGGAIVYPLPSGTLWHANALAQFLVLAVLGLVALALTESRRTRTFAIGVGVVGTLALVVTFSRASWIALVAGLAVYVVEPRTRRVALTASGALVAGGLGLALFGVGAIGARVSSLFESATSGLADFRVELAERALSSAGRHPLTGAGEFAEYGQYAGRLDFAPHPHNLLLGVAVFFGVPAALSLATLIGLAVRAAVSGVLHAGGAERLRAVGFVAVLVALIVNGLLEYPLWNEALAALIVLLLGTIVGLDPKARRELVLRRRR